MSRDVARLLVLDLTWHYFTTSYTLSEDVDDMLTVHFISQDLMRFELQAREQLGDEAIQNIIRDLRAPRTWKPRKRRRAAEGVAGRAGPRRAGRARGRGRGRGRGRPAAEDPEPVQTEPAQSDSEDAANESDKEAPAEVVV